jgi:plastocyanin
MKNKILLVVMTIMAVVVFSVLILQACRNEEPQEVTQETVKPVQEFPVMEASKISHITTVMVNERGYFDYENGLIRVYPGETVIWKCITKGPFTIHIGWNSPFKACSFHSLKGEEIRAELPEDAPPGYYRYMIAVLVGDKIYTDDPELIVKRPPIER